MCVVWTEVRQFLSFACIHDYSLYVNLKAKNPHGTHSDGKLHACFHRKHFLCTIISTLFTYTLKINSISVLSCWIKERNACIMMTCYDIACNLSYPNHSPFLVILAELRFPYYCCKYHLQSTQFILCIRFNEFYLFLCHRNANSSHMEYIFSSNPFEYKTVDNIWIFLSAQSNIIQRESAVWCVHK